MPSRDDKPHTRFDELKLGDRIEVEHTSDREEAARKSSGVVVRIEHHAHGPRCRIGSKEKAAGNTTHGMILLELPDGELAAIPVNNSTIFRPA